MSRRRRNQLTLVCWIYPGPRNYRPKYVNVLYQRVKQFMPMRHRFVCIYDDTYYKAEHFDPGIELMPIPESARPLLALGSLASKMHPACFARLWHFSEEAAELLPGRVFMFDVDSIPIGDMSPLVKYRSDADFVGLRCGGTERLRHYLAGGSWILRSGSLTHVWNDFIADPIQARADAAAWFVEGRDLQYVGWIGGSDQAYMSYRLVDHISEDGPITYWNGDFGILLWDRFRRERGQVDGCLLHFNGHKKPWSLDWKLTRELYGNVEYCVIGRPLKYGGRRYEVGEPFIAARPSHARALLAVNRIAVA